MNTKHSICQYCQLHSSSSDSVDPRAVSDLTQIENLRYAIAIESFDTNYSAYCLDFPDCTAAGDTIESAKQALGKKLTQRLRRMLDNGEEIPLPKIIIKWIEIDIPTVNS